ASSSAVAELGPISRYLSSEQGTGYFVFENTRAAAVQRLAQNLSHEDLFSFSARDRRITFQEINAVWGSSLRFAELRKLFRDNGFVVTDLFPSDRHLVSVTSLMFLLKEERSWNRFMERSGWKQERGKSPVDTIFAELIADLREVERSLPGSPL